MTVSKTGANRTGGDPEPLAILNDIKQAVKDNGEESRRELKSLLDNQLNLLKRLQKFSSELEANIKLVRESLTP